MIPNVPISRKRPVPTETEGPKKNKKKKKKFTKDEKLVNKAFHALGYSKYREESDDDDDEDYFIDPETGFCHEGKGRGGGKGDGGSAVV
jgi:hypothetical protein